jgi:hypothetical protein
MNRGRVGEERGGKEKDGCPLTLTQSLQKHQTHSTKLEETSKTESNKRRKNSFKKYSKKHTLTTFGLLGNGPKAHKTTQYLPYLEDQTD